MIKNSLVSQLKEFFDCSNLQIRTLKGKKVGVSASFLKNGETYAFKTSKTCIAKYVPLACRPQTPTADASISEEKLQEPDEESA